MSDDGTADRLQRYFAEHEQISDAARATAKDLFGLRSIDDELIELSAVGAVRDGSTHESDDVLRFEFRGVTILVERSVGGSRVVVLPPEADVSTETADGTRRLETDAAGEAVVTGSQVVRLRVRGPDGASGVTDGFVPGGGG